MHRRLDQLRLLDDTKFGLVLVWLLLVAETATTARFGGAAAAKLLQLPASSAAPMQMALLALTAMGLIVWRWARIGRRLRLRRLEEVDPALHEDASYLARKMVAREPRFLLTGRLDDINAFCMPAFPRPWVVIGGGLRILMRKAREEAQAIVAHECAHVGRGDALVLVVTWHTYIAFLVLAELSFLVLQGQFWLKLPDREAAHGFAAVDLFEAFRQGGPTVIATVFIGLVLAHFVRLREFIADESAARVGLRSGLVDTLERDIARRGGKSVLRLHPMARVRLTRVRTGIGWARVDVALCFSAAASTARLMQTGVLSLVGIDEPRLPDADASFEEIMVDHGGASGVALLMCLTWGSIALMAFVVANHLYRVVLSRMVLGRTAAVSRALVAALCACLAGSLSGLLLSPSTLQALSDARISTSVILPIADLAMATCFAFVSSLAPFLAGGASLALIAARFHPPRSPWSWVSFFGGWLLASFFWFCVFAWSAMLAQQSGWLGWTMNLSWLEETSRPNPAGVHSLLGGFVCMAAVLLFMLLSGTAWRALRRKASTPIHPDRLVAA